MELMGGMENRIIREKRKKKRGDRTKREYDKEI